MSTRYAIIFGTRPEIIKMAPFIHAARSRGRSFFIIHTGQHYSEIMDKVFWDNLDLPDPEYNLGIGSGSHAEQVGKMMVGIEEVILKEKPDAVCVYADLNTSIAGAVAASKIHIPIIQLEAGLRSFDRTMPEEINRLVVDRVASLHFAPTPLQVDHLRAEGITESVRMVGNMITDVVGKMAPLAKQKSDIISRLGLEPRGYFLATLHRSGGVDSPVHFANMFEGLRRIAAEHHIPVIYPMHPRSQKNVATFGLTIPEGVRVIDPLDYFDFLALMQDARLLLSDSGGIQEEACILQIPLVTLRENTERQETLTLGSNMLAGFSPEEIVRCVNAMLAKEPTWQHPYGAGVAEKIWDAIDAVFQP